MCFCFSPSQQTKVARCYNGVFSLEALGVERRDDPNKSLKPIGSMGLEGIFTPWKFNIAPENGWLEDYFPVGKVTGLF